MSKGIGLIIRRCLSGMVKAFEALLVVIGLMMLGFVVIAASFYAIHKSHFLQRELHEALGIKLHFKIAQFDWNHATPELTLTHIRLASVRTPNQPALQIKKIEFQFNLLQMLHYLKPATNWIRFSGVRLFVRQGDRGLWQLRGFSHGVSSSTTTSKPPGLMFYWPHCWAWLQPQQRIHIRANVIIFGPQDKRINTSHLDFLWQSRHPGQHYLEALLTGMQQHKKQINAKVQAIFTGSLLLPSTFQAHFYVAAQGRNIGYIIDRLKIFGMRWKQGKGSLELWGNWRDAALSRIHGLFQLQDIALFNPQAQVNVSIPAFNENILWQRTAQNNWQLLMNPYYYHKGQVIDDPTKALFIKKQAVEQGVRWSAYIGQIRMALLSKILQVMPKMPKHIQGALAGMSPQGTLQKFYFSILQRGQRWSAYHFSTRFNHLAINQWEGFPAVNSLFGTLKFDTDQGVLTIQAKPFYMGANAWFPLAWPKSTLQTTVQWHKQNQRWRVEPTVLLQNHWLTFHAKGVALVPIDHWQATQLRLMANATAVQGQDVLRNYIPSHLLPPVLDTWLKQAVVAAPQSSMAFLFRGQLNQIPFHQHQGVMMSQVSADHVTFSPDRGWPVIKKLSALVSLYQDALTVQAKNGQSVGVGVKHVLVTVNHLGSSKPGQVSIHAKVETKGSRGQYYIAHSPLAAYLKGLQSYFKFMGKVKLGLNIILPLNQPAKKLQFSGVVHLFNNQVQVAKTPILFKKVSGDVQFLNAGVFAKNVTALLWGEPLTVNIDSQGNFYDLAKLEESVIFQGKLNLQLFAEAFSVPFSNRLLGVAPFTAQLQYQNLAWSFGLHSNLKGVEFNFPAPFSMQANMLMPLTVSANLKNPAAIPVSLQLGNLLSGRFWFARKAGKEHLQKGYVLLGLKKTLPEPKQPGLLITGIIPYFSVAEWQKIFEPYFKKFHASSQQGAQQKAATILRKIDLRIGNLNIYGYQFNALDLSIVPTQNAWQFSVNSQQAKGTVTIPDRMPLSIQGDFTHLALQTMPVQKKKSAQLKKPVKPISATTAVKKASILAKIKPYLNPHLLSKVPALSLKIQSLDWNQSKLGALDWLSVPSARGIVVKHLKLVNTQSRYDLHGSLNSVGKTSRVAIAGDIHSKNWGKVFSVLGYKDFMQGGEGDINLDVQWFGGADIDMASLNGQLAFDFTDGALISIKPGLAKLLGLTDITSLFQRLQLSAKKIGDRGLAFDHLQGHYTLYDGVASTKNVSLSGPSLDLLMKGSVDLVNKQLDQTVVVMLHLGSGVALAAGLLGGPIAAVAAWVGEKILTSTVLKNKGIVYHVTGSWDNPKVVNAGSNLGH